MAGERERERERERPFIILSLEVKKKILMVYFDVGLLE